MAEEKQDAESAPPQVPVTSTQAMAKGESKVSEIKSDKQYLQEVKDWPNILRMRAIILGQLAIKRRGK